MKHRFLIVLLAAGALAACKHDAPDREPVDRSPAPSMDDAPPPRFGQDQPALPPRQPDAPPERQSAAKIAPQEPPQRPPAEIPNAGPAAPADVRPGVDNLPDAYKSARTTATAPRPAAGTGARPLYSAPLSQLVDAHIARSPLKVRADNDAEYFITAQSGQLGEQKAYLVLARPGAGSPGSADIGDISRTLGGFLPVGGSISQLDAGGQRFGLQMHASASDSACAASHPSQIEVWAFNHHDQAHTIQFSVSLLFASTAKAGVPLNGANGSATLVAYRDGPAGSGKVSLALFEQDGRMTPVPSTLLSRQDGKAVSIALHSNPAQRFGLRLTGSALEVFDMSAQGQKPAAVPYESLVPAYHCG